MEKFKKVKGWFIALAVLFAVGSGIGIAASGDIVSWNDQFGKQSWHVNSSSTLMPPAASTGDIGSSATPLGTLYGTGFSVPSFGLKFHIQLTSAQIVAMNGTAVPLVSGPGAGSFLCLTSPVHIRNTFGTSATGGGGPVVIQWHGGTVAATTTMAASQVNLSSGSNENVLIPVAATPQNSTGTTTTDAGALEITCGTGTFTKTSSTTTMDIWFTYRL